MKKLGYNQELGVRTLLFFSSMRPVHMRRCMQHATKHQVLYDVRNVWLVRLSLTRQNSRGSHSSSETTSRGAAEKVKSRVILSWRLWTKNSIKQSLLHSENCRKTWLAGESERGGDQDQASTLSTPWKRELFCTRTSNKALSSGPTTVFRNSLEHCQAKKVDFGSNFLLSCKAFSTRKILSQ